MFDLFAPTRSEIRKSHLEFCTTNLAIVMLLVEKGVCTEDEYIAMRIKATHYIEQLDAKRTEEAMNDPDNKAAQVMNSLNKLFGDLG